MTENDRQAIEDAIFLMRSMHAAFNSDAPAYYKLGLLFIAFCYVAFKGQGSVPASKIAEYCNITQDEAEHVAKTVDELETLLWEADGEEAEAFVRAIKGIVGQGGEA